MDTKIQQQVLSESIQKVINKRKIKALAFFTFMFDPGFFEEEILPVFFDIPLSHHPKIRLVQLEDYLRGYSNIAVYYDRRGILAESEPARLDFQKLGLSRSTGYFHPKNIFIIVENYDNKNEEVWDSLITVTTSANLTRSGWWENVESVYIDEVESGFKCSYRRDLLELFSNIRKEDKTGDNHDVLEIIRKFIVYELDDYAINKMDGKWLTRIFCGQYDLPEFLSDYLDYPYEYNLEIISPYFDDTDSASTINDLIEIISPKEVRIFLPESDDGTLLCNEKYYKAVSELSNVKWGVLPQNIISMGSGDKNIKSRFVHAKVYRFWSQKHNREFFLIGSPNLTSAAHKSIRSGNFESAVLVEPEVQGRLIWWLNPLEDKRNPSFKVIEDGVEESDEFISGLSIRFNWNNDIAEYFWENSSNENINEAHFIFKGERLFTLSPVRFNKWIKIDDNKSNSIKAILSTTSLIKVKVSENRSAIILIREEGMAKKPSLLTNLTAEEILRYWSLLSPEQKEYFLEKKIAIQLGLSEYSGQYTNEEKPDSMFDKFAGIFHAFGKLRKQAYGSIEEGKYREAEYRLFGEKYDSLPNLIDKVIEDDSIELVNKYVMLLSALQLLKELQKKNDFEDFKLLYKDDIKKLIDKLSAIESIKTKFSFDSEKEREKFFDWYEDMFMIELDTNEDLAQ